MFENTEFDFDAVSMNLDEPVSMSIRTRNIVSGKRPNDAVSEEKHKKFKVDVSCDDIHVSVRSPKTSNTTYDSPAKTVKRKFPGPAGLLPDDECSKSFSEADFPDNDTKTDEVILCSQQTVTSFEGGPWSQMKQDFQSSDRLPLYEKFDIGWIKSNCSTRKLLKAPFLAAIVQSVDVIHANNPIVNIKLKDLTGEIEGTILNSLYEGRCELFSTGSVIVLRQFGVITLRNNFFITITPNSLLAIYSLDNERKSVNRCVLKEFKVEDIWTKCEEEVSQNFQQTINLNEQTFQATNTTKVEGLVHNPSVNDHKADNIFKTISYDKQRISGLIENSLKHFRFKKTSTDDSLIEKENQKEENINNSQITIKSDSNNMQVWEDLFEDVDPSSLFDEF